MPNYFNLDKIEVLYANGDSPTQDITRISAVLAVFFSRQKRSEELPLDLAASFIKPNMFVAIRTFPNDPPNTSNVRLVFSGIQEADPHHSSVSEADLPCLAESISAAVGGHERKCVVDVVLGRYIGTPSEDPRRSMRVPAPAPNGGTSGFDDMDDDIPF